MLHLPLQLGHEVFFALAGNERLAEGLPDLITTSGVRRDECEETAPFLTRQRLIHCLNTSMTNDRSRLLVLRAIRCLP
jgi:hypothetical protein